MTRQIGYLPGTFIPPRDCVPIPPHNLWIRAAGSKFRNAPGGVEAALCNCSLKSLRNILFHYFADGLPRPGRAPPPLPATGPIPGGRREEARAAAPTFPFTSSREAII